MKIQTYAKSWRGEKGTVTNLQVVAMNRHLVFLILACAFSTAAGQCTFPNALRATWLTSSNGNITITSNTIENYPIGSFGSFDFDCNQEYGGRYVLKTQNTFTVIGLTMYAYLCFDFNAVSSNLYYYYLASNDTNGIQAIFKVQWDSPTVDEVCAQTASQYDPGRYQVMIKNGDASAAKQVCPIDLVSSFSYEMDSGSGNTCSAGGDLDGCTGSQLSLNCSACATSVFYSSGGVVYCLNSVTSGSLTYMTVYNTDATVDNSNTYRMACLVYNVSGDTTYMSQHPETCETGQTDKVVTTPTASLITLRNSTTCPTPVETQSITIYIVLGAIGGIVVLFVIGLSIFMFLTWKAKQKPFRGRLEPEPPEEKSPRLQAFENGFRRIKPSGTDRPLSREGTPDIDDDTPINVMQLLRKDIITPGGRESPASNVILSVTTPNPYSYHDGDSIGGGSLPIPEENPNMKKHYHVIGGEPSIGGLEEEDEIDGSEADGVPHNPRVGSGRNARTPVMVMPVRSDGSEMFDGEDDDISDNDDGMYDADGLSTLVGAKQGVGINEPMCPPSRLPPIDEGPASHRSYTGSGNTNSISRKSRSQTATFSEQNPTIFEEDTPRSDTETPLTIEAPHMDLPSRPSSRAETPLGRRSSLGLLYQMDGNKMVAIPDIIEQVTMGSGAVDKKQQNKTAVENKGRKDGAKLKSFGSRSATKRRGSGGSLIHGNRHATHSADSRKKRTAGPSNSASGKAKHHELALMEEENSTPRSRVKMTRVNIPELLPLGELPKHAPEENELLESPGRAYHNAAYELDVEQGHGDDSTGEGTPRKLWLQPVKPTEDVWNRVSHLWRLGQAWPDKHT